MKAVRLHAYHKDLELNEVPEPRVSGPHDVIVRIAGAGLCRTDLHIRDGWFAPAVPTELPLTLGHENTGWVHEVGPAVEHIAVGDPVICHPQLSCGFCAACRVGDDMRCTSGLNFTGLTRDGGFADLMRTTDRGVLHLPPGLDPAELAPLADAGLAAMHVVRKAAPAARRRHHGRRGRGRRSRAPRYPVPARAHRHASHRGRPGSRSPLPGQGLRCARGHDL
jgi:NAD+-dependent secondary alcohol dehydrogenase Adh1